MSDPEGRRTLQDLVADRPERLFHVGRLDTDTSGLILLTNDGDFAHRMAHPSYEVDKTYVAEVEGVPSPGRRSRRSRDGVTLEDGPVAVSSARLVTRGQGGAQGRAIVELVIHEGRNRIVRRLLDHVGHPVRRLTRTAIGPVQLRGLPVGEAARADVGRARLAAGQRRTLTRRRSPQAVASWQCVRCGGRPSSRPTPASTCSSGWPRWSST